jgi:hypothetical protein
MSRAEIESLLAFRAVMILGFVDGIARGAGPEHLAELETLIAEERAALGRPGALATLDFRPSTKSSPPRAVKPVSTRCSSARLRTGAHLPRGARVPSRRV